MRTPEGRIALHKPFIDFGDRENVDHCVAGEPVGYGFIGFFERLLAETCGVEHAIAMSSGTAALHIALLAIGIKPGQRVRAPSMTFAGTAAAVTYCGAEPIFGPSAIAPAAMISVDLLGHPDRNAYAFDGPIIEDAAEALGSRCMDKPCGSFGDVGVLSFNNNKIVTTGGGGALLTNDGEIAHKARHLATTARITSDFYYDHDAIGFNYRMSNMQAALGLGQLRRLESIVAEKRSIADEYEDAFVGLSGVKVMRESPTSRANYWLNAIEVDPQYREHVLTTLHAHGIAARALFTPLPTMIPYRKCQRDRMELYEAEERFRRTILLPSGNRS